MEVTEGFPTTIHTGNTLLHLPSSLDHLSIEVLYEHSVEVYICNCCEYSFEPRLQNLLLI